MVSQYLVALYLAQVRGSMFPEEITEMLDRMTSCQRRCSERSIWTARCASWPSAFVTLATCCSFGRHTATLRRSKVH